MLFKTAEMEEAAAAEIAAMHGQPVVIETDKLTAFLIVGFVQLALRHPGNQGASARTMEKFARDLGAQLAAPGSAAQRIIEAGWDPAQDV